MGSMFGCATASKIVGTWEAEIQGSHMTQTMNPDNTYDARLQISLPTGQQVTINVEGSYKLEGDQLTMAASDVHVEGADKSFADDLKKNTENSLKKPNTAPITWKTDDEFVTTAPGGGQVTFKRKKA